MCVGRCKRLFYCLCGGGGTRAPSSFPIPDEAPPSRLRGCGQKEEVKLRGGVCRLTERGVLVCRSERTKEKLERKRSSVWKTVGFSRRARGGFEASERRLRKKVQSVWKQSLSRRARVFEASERRRHSVGSAGRDAEPACTLSQHFWQ